MGVQTKQVGGGAATGLGNDFVKFLQSGMNTGTFGGVSSGQRYGESNPTTSTQGIAGVLNDILSGGAGKAGGALSDLIGRQQGRDVNALRARFTASGGSSLGTPAATAESLYRAQAAPEFTNALTQMQMGVLGPLLAQIGGLSQKGIPQAEMMQTQNPLTSVIGSVASGAGAIAPFFRSGLPSGGASPTNIAGISDGANSAIASSPYFQNAGNFALPFLGF